MAEEVKLSPGWLLRDVRRAAERLDPSQRQQADPVDRGRHDVSVGRTDAYSQEEPRSEEGFRSCISS
jgi:hypothetical protein